MSTYIVYGISDCPACLRACADLMEADNEYVFVEMDFSKTYREYIKDRHQWPTFPFPSHDQSRVVPPCIPHSNYHVNEPGDFIYSFSWS